MSQFVSTALQPYIEHHRDDSVSCAPSLWSVEHSCNICPCTAFSTWYWGNQFLQSPLVCHLLQTPSRCGSSLLNFTQYMNVFLGSPEPRLALTEWFYKCQTEGRKHFPEPAGYACSYSPVSKFSSLSLIQYLYYLLLLSVWNRFFSKPLSPPWLPLLAFFMFHFSILPPPSLCPHCPPHYLPALFSVSRTSIIARNCFTYIGDLRCWQGVRNISNTWKIKSFKVLASYHIFS